MCRDWGVERFLPPFFKDVLAARLLTEEWPDGKQFRGARETSLLCLREQQRAPTIIFADNQATSRDRKWTCAPKCCASHQAFPIVCKERFSHTVKLS